jgi:hypothetical protein
MIFTIFGKGISVNSKNETLPLHNLHARLRLANIVDNYVGRMWKILADRNRAFIIQGLSITCLEV